MKKGIISVIIVGTMLLSSVSAFANNSECIGENANCIVQEKEDKEILCDVEQDKCGTEIATEEPVTEETVSEKTVAEESETEEPSLEVDGQIMVLPIVSERIGRQKDLADNDISLFTESTNPVVTYISTGNFYADEEVFNITVDIENAKDVRSKLKISVVDDEDVTVATQQNVFYQNSYSDEAASLNYTMKRTKAISEDKSYFVKFVYTGKYEIGYDVYSAEINPITDVEIKSIELIDVIDNSFRIVLANAKAGEQYILRYESYPDDIEKTCTVSSDLSVVVSFGGTFSSYGDIYLYYPDYTSEWDYIDRTDLYDFDMYEYYEDSYNGVGCDDYISTADDTVWIYLWEKGFGYQSYKTSDLSKFSAYMMDVTTGETIGQLQDKDYYEYGDGYCQLDGNIKLAKKLDESHKYIIVCNDGYTLRIHDDFIVTSDKKITNSYYYVNLTDETNTQPENMPSGIKTFYAFVSSINISDRNNIKVELVDSTGKTIATGSYDKNNRYLMTASSEIKAGEYTLKAKYGDLLYTDKLKFSDGMSGAAYQLVQNVVVYNGKAYLLARLESKTLDPKKMNFEVEIDDGRVFEAEYHRSLYSNNDNHYFIVTIDDALTNVDYSNKGFLKMYSDSTYIVPEYVGNMDFTVRNRTSSPFMYDTIKFTETGVEIFVEGVNSETGTYTLSAIDDETELSKTINLTKKTGEQTLVASKTDLDKITVKYPIMMGYGVTNKEYYIEKDNELFGSLYSSEIGKSVLDSTYGFLKTYTNNQYEVLNLPYTEYSSYRVATSEKELSSKSYQTIDVGLLHKLSNTNGVQKVYAQFKTSAGKESAVISASIMFDNIAPALEITTDVKTSYVLDEYDEFEIEIGVNATEGGNIHFNFYDENNNQIGYDQTRNITEGSDIINSTFWSDDYNNYEDAKKLIIYMTDNAGNKSTEYSFPISVVRQYSIYETDTTYIRLNNETGVIEEFDSTEESVVIPSEINGVKVVGIGEYAFVNNDVAISIKIPDTVTSIDENAFADLDDYTLLVKEGSAAHNFAVTNEITFELVTYKIGDIFEDDSVNSKDAIKLSQYLAKWAVNLTDDQKSAADIFVDGYINSKDSIKLSQYLAKWNVTLE